MSDLILAPEFLSAGREYQRLVESGQAQSREAADALRQMLEHAPESFLNELHDMAVQMGLMPATPDGYTDDGQPVYNIKGIAARLDTSEAELQMVADEIGIVPVNNAAIHRVN